jgi:hypothetical protein
MVNFRVYTHSTGKVWLLVSVSAFNLIEMILYQSQALSTLRHVSRHVGNIAQLQLVLLSSLFKPDDYFT